MRRGSNRLVGDLGYRGPALLFKAVLSVRSAACKPAFFKRAIDLGCGTGLAATAFAKAVDHFIGVDLSPRMIEQARATGLYAELEVADMLQGLRAGRTPALISFLPRMRWYTSPISHRCWLKQAACWSPAGCSLSPPKPMTGRRHHRPGLRYAHRPLTCVMRLMAPAPNCRCSIICSARNEDHAPVPGLVAVAAKT